MHSRAVESLIFSLSVVIDLQCITIRVGTEPTLPSQWLGGQHGEKSQKTKTKSAAKKAPAKKTAKRKVAKKK